ncbi:MAG: hypothetical protein A2173_03840 [Planctomycetes bacterium RBG_13_44_8b]|nr:MAG: hypothetical protein A2173_03840 [Planctomycetes bacterium RBG_13_44_8b]
MSIPSKQFCQGSHVHQKALFNAFDQRLNIGIRTPQMFMAEWHRRCRKTTAALNLNIRQCCRVPKGKYGHIAPTQVMARNIIWDDPNMLRAYLPEQREMEWKLNEQKMLVTFENKSILKIGGADEPDAWRGTDFIGVTCDEWSLMKENLWTEILRPVIAAPLPPHLLKYPIFRWALFLYTPKSTNHASQMFDKACCLGDGGVLPDCGIAQKLLPNWFASRVDGEKSGIFSQQELSRMREEIPKALYDQEIKCSRVTMEEMTLITSEMIQALNDYHAKTKISFQETRKIVSIDPAWGGDVCKIMGLVNNAVEAEKSILDRHRAPEIIMAAKLVAQNIGTKNFIVDTVNDLSIADGLAVDDAGYNVQYFKSSNKATEKQDTQQAIRFANRRAEAYYYTSRQVAQFLCGSIKGNELIRQLIIASRYTTQGGSGKLIIIPKLKIKQDLGCSPDEADCYVMGIWGAQNVQPETDDITLKIGAMNLIPDFVGV